MSSPFGASLRRDPDDPRGLIERIEAGVRERIEEAVEFACMELLVQLRRAHGRPAPEANRESDRRAFRALVEELLRHLRGGFLEGLSEGELRKVRQAEEAHQEELPRLVAGQAALARALPDYWERFESLRSAFSAARLAAPPPRPGLLGRFLRGS